MANTCFNQIKITGSQKDLTKIYDAIKKALEDNESSFSWLEASDFLELFGIKKKNIPSDLREAITDIKEIQDGVLKISSESSWNFKPDIWRALRTVFHDIDIYYLAEEFGCEIFVTNDTTETMFPVKYALDFDFEGYPEPGVNYFNSEEELLDFCRKVFKKNYRSAEEVEKKLDDWLRENSEDNFAVLHEIEYAEDDTDLWCEQD